MYLPPRMSDSECSSRRRLVRNQSEGEARERVREPAPRRRPAYGVIGADTCMGDHKVRHHIPTTPHTRKAYCDIISRQLDFYDDHIQ